MSRKKRSYRSVDVKKLDQEKLAEIVAGKRTVFGVDIAKHKNYGTFMSEDRDSVATIRWHNVDETLEVIELLRGLPSSQLEIALEPTGTYGDPFRVKANEMGLPVYQVGAKRSHDAAEVWDGVPSMHDAKSAEVVARLHLDGASKLWKQRGDDERELAAKVALMNVHNGAYISMIGHIEGKLARHWPELTSYLDLTTVTLMELLIETGGPRLVRERPGEAASLMKRVGRYFLSDDKINGVVESAQQTIGVPMIEAEEEELRELAWEARRAQKRERQLGIEVERLVQKDKEFKCISEVTGKRTAAVLKACIGSISEYENAASVEKALGLNLKIRSSGKKKGQLKITKRGPSLPRKYLYLAALRLPQRSPLARAWYEAKVQRSGGVKNKAVIAVMRKLVRALWYVAGGDKFDASKLFNEAHLKAQLRRAQ